MATLLVIVDTIWSRSRVYNASGVSEVDSIWEDFKIHRNTHASFPDHTDPRRPPKSTKLTNPKKTEQVFNDLKNSKGREPSKSGGRVKVEHGRPEKHQLHCNVDAYLGLLELHSVIQINRCKRDVEDLENEDAEDYEFPKAV
ncbi:hypothetical protein PF005_g7911 [Phytophthora fragariae]|nr:hypothetical protein PF006_g7466 [Phytophthora fragariae]KAE9219330.1 hypothetical protein PF005_g7911 [Phytophthora fragariae]KAE9241322.1 hypothetical protein PF004_g7105 [Phytophthora fragariae]KAE9315975.1 hypothetical protein PF001_g7526 [Phytophthora fragariae]